MPPAGAPAVALRPATPADEPFLAAVYAATRADEMTAFGFDAATAGAFLSQQFTAQDRSYRQAYPAARFDIILVGGQPAGRLYVDRGREAVHVIDIALLPEHRGRGIGTRLLRDLLAEAAATDRAVTLSALRGGRVLELYARLGFVQTGGDDVYVALAWRQANTA